MAQKIQFRRSHKYAMASISALALVAFSFQNFIEPEAPIRNIDTRTVQKDNVTGKYTPTSNFIPTTEYTQDGRLALAWRRGSGPLLVLTRPENIKDHLFSKLNDVLGAGFVNTAGYDHVLNVTQAHQAKKNAIGANMKLGGRSLLCERTEKVQNPTVCAAGFDCYNFVLIVSYYEKIESGPHKGKTRYKLVSSDVSVKVGQPKTPRAYLAEVKVNPSSTKIGPEHVYPILAEPTIPGDSRLLVTRLSSAQVALTDKDKNGNPIKKDQINLVYSVYDQKYEQCDVTRWTDFHPISHAHYDKKNKMKARYKFARFPIRDSLGNIVPNGEEFGGTYPWMDRHAANIFFTTFGFNNFYNFVTTNKNTKEGYVVTPFKDKGGRTSLGSPGYFNMDDIRNYEDYAAAKRLVETSGPVGGFSVTGFWTHGKIILLDGLINNADFMFRISDRLVNKNFETKPADGKTPYRVGVDREIKLYRDKGYEKVGAVREKGDEALMSEYARMLTPNSTFSSSIENRLNYNKNIFPVTPRDVVWHFGTSRHAEELAFDDYNSFFMLINAEMTAALAAEIYTVSGRERSMHHLAGHRKGVEEPQIEGFPRCLDGKANQLGYCPGGTIFPALIQNSGTAPDSFMTLPYYGKINMRYSRIEPIAKGGIFGKGLWMEDKGSLQFQIPKQTGAKFSIAKNKNWYAGVFFDGRDDYKVTDRVDLMSFGNNVIRLKKSRPGVHLFDRVLFVKNGKEIGRVVFPGGLVPFKEVWSHIGVSFAANQTPEVFFNGFSIGHAHPVGGATAPELYNFIALNEGADVYLGDSPKSPLPGIKGWFDDFKVVARVPTLEEACNYARGTLVALSSSDTTSALARVANRYPAASHETIAKAIYEDNPKQRYACHNRYFHSNKPETVMYAEDHAHLKNLPPGSRSIREDVLGTKNMLVYGRPRPDFSTNKFCLSCHTADHPFNEMDDTALIKGAANVPMQADPRRQPMQPDRYLRGIIPANYFGAGLPAGMISAAKTEVDKFIHPARSHVDIKWNQLGPKYLYSLDLRDSSSGKEVAIGACVSAGIIKNSTLYRLNSKCTNGHKFPITHEVKVRICYTGNGVWKGSSVKCTRYTPLNMHNEGVLNLFLER